MTSTVKYLVHTAVIDDDSSETGLVKMKKVQEHEVIGLVEFTEPDRRVIAFAHSQVQIYYPKIKTVQIYDLGSHGEQLDQFLLLGFGTSGTELAKVYAMKITGTESVQGQPATILELTPKSADLRQYLRKVELWLPQAPKPPYPLQEKLYEPSGNFRVMTYLDLKINIPLPDDALKLKLPKGVKKEYPQKAQ
jgi:outer membrane lipoprotein-sorting protein